MSMSFSLSVLLLILFCIPTINFMVVFHHRVWISRANTAMAEEAKLTSVEFEVYGLVQGVFFRKNTVERGRQLGLRGWCMNTHRGTVLGLLEGEPVKVEEMCRAGNPTSSLGQPPPCVASRQLGNAME
ncbi:acylphosphatase-1-like isoform X1 [Periplaneta americana]|uniref:acylphosphatase-1-like isoform X1 n=1 Tax=Periplaneta americana TaxID=6978 RepID=UPI0037E7E9B2